MSVEREVGELKAEVAHIKEDVRYIRDHMVTRREFEQTAAEHRGFRQDIDSLLQSRAKHTLLVTWGERMLWACIAVGTAALFGVGI